MPYVLVIHGFKITYNIHVQTSATPHQFLLRPTYPYSQLTPWYCSNKRAFHIKFTALIVKYMEAIRKTTNSNSRGRKHIQQDLGYTREPYIVTDEDKGRRAGEEWETHHGKL